MTNEQSTDAADKSSRISSDLEQSTTKQKEIQETSRDNSLSGSPRKRRLSQVSEGDADDLEDEDFEVVEEAEEEEGHPGTVPSGQSNTGDTPSICLCQPTQRAPRPRNAFILFRSHYQAEVAREHPGAANPEISKILGDAWKKASPETKKKWQGFYQEELIRHQKLYPGYRYQPRRAGRNSSGDQTAESSSCQKCGGKKMSTRLPTPTALPGVSPPSGGRLPPPTPSSGRYSQHAPSPQPRGSYGSHGSHGGQPPYGYRNSRDSGYESLPYSNESPTISPDAKRRRLESQYLPGANRAGSIAAAVNNAIVYDRRRLSSLPRPDLMQKRISVNAPPRPPHASPNGPPSSSLTLAPLKINNGPGAPNSHSKAIEAMVMSIPTLNKVKVLSKISPPLQPPSATSPPHPTRGAIIAIEGSDDEALKTVITHLRDLLEKDDEHRVRLYYGGRFSVRKDSSGFAEWLELIKNWHNESRSIRKFITTPVGAVNESPQVSPSTVPGLPAKSPSKPYDLRSKDPDAMDTSGGSKPSSPTNAPTGASKDAGAAASDPKPADTTPLAPKGPMPVAIIPRFQLSLTDAAASSVPISDEYSPTDHWQWMATLWRGITGPDVTVVVKSAGSHGVEEAGQPGAGAGKEGGKGLEVDVRLNDYRAVVLRCEREGRVGERDLRRMGFEVGEWLRGMGEREGRKI